MEAKKSDSQLTDTPLTPPENSLENNPNEQLESAPEIATETLRQNREKAAEIGATLADNVIGEVTSKAKETLNSIDLKNSTKELVEKEFADIFDKLDRDSANKLRQLIDAQSNDFAKTQNTTSVNHSDENIPSADTKLVESEEHSVADSIGLSLKNQLKSVGHSTIASLIALIIAIISPLILNSQFAQDVKVTIDDIRAQLPTEADDLIVTQLNAMTQGNQNRLNEINLVQATLKAESANLKENTQAYKDQIQQMMIRMESMSVQSEALNAELKKLGKLEQKIAQLEKTTQKFSSSTLSADPTNLPLYKQISSLYQQGGSLTEEKPKEAERWFKTVFYTVQGLQTQQTAEQLQTHIKALNAIVEKEGDFKSFDDRKEEALIILNAIGSLAKASIIG